MITLNRALPPARAGDRARRLRRRVGMDGAGSRRPRRRRPSRAALPSHSRHHPWSRPLALELRLVGGVSGAAVLSPRPLLSGGARASRGARLPGPGRDLSRPRVARLPPAGSQLLFPPQSGARIWLARAARRLPRAHHLGGVAQRNRGGLALGPRGRAVGLGPAAAPRALAAAMAGGYVAAPGAG